MDEAQQRVLLKLARETIQAKLAGQPLPALPVIGEEPVAFGGAFVTLWNRGRLRGCMGRFNPESDLVSTVQQMAQTVLSDPRFLHCCVTADELPEIAVEISVLSPMKRTSDPLSLELGVHGIYIRRGVSSGCFLPQVATEQKWDREQFLSRCCESKAGLPADAWRDPETEVCLFTAEVLHEEGK